MNSTNIISKLIWGLGILGAGSVLGCSGVDAQSSEDSSQATFKLEEEDEVDDDNVIAPDRFCKARDRNVQVNLSGLSWTRTPGVLVNWPNMPGDGQNNVEGPTWHNGALYYSNLGPGNAAVMWRLEPGSVATKFIDVAKGGTNGNVVNFQGKLLSARQLDGSITSFKWNNPEKKPKTIAGLYNDRPFNAPNDLTVARDGTIYFTDPLWNVPEGINPQLTRQGGGDFPDRITEGQRVYRVDTEGTVTALDIRTTGEVLYDAAHPDGPPGGANLRNRPNGIMLSLDEKFLIVGGAEGAYRFNLSEDGELSNGQRLFPQTNQQAQAIQGPTDGMARDCAGNIYVTAGGPGGNRILVFSARSELLGAIPAPAGVDFNTNVTFGGNDGKTLYVSVPNWGGPEAAGLFEIHMNIAGYPQ